MTSPFQGGLRSVAADQALAVVVALVIAGAAGWVGIQARHASDALVIKRTALRDVNDQLSSTKRQFRGPTPTESAALQTEAARLSSLGVPENRRLSMVDSIGRVAESVGLTGVRVSSGTRNDSLFLPVRVIAGQTLGSASYELNVEFTGGFASVVKFVSSLPPSVSVTHMAAGRREPSTAYRMTLLVYKLDGTQP